MEKKESEGGRKSLPDHSLHPSLRLCVCKRRSHFHGTGRPTDETLLGRLISHISETWQDKASHTAVGARPICLLLSSNQGQIDLFSSYKGFRCLLSSG